VGLGAGALADQLLSVNGWSVRSVRTTLQLAGKCCCFLPHLGLCMWGVWVSSVWG